MEKSMRIAIMLAIHNNPEQANIFINQCLAYSDCKVFVHIDKKAAHIAAGLVKDDRVHVLPKSYSVSWGDFSQIQYVLYMMKYIQEQGSFDYCSIHSGNDMLVRPMSELADYLKTDNKYAYLDCYPLPWDQWQYGGGLGRLRLIWPKWMRTRLTPHSLKRYIRALYGRMDALPFLRLRKLPEGVRFYGKSAWYTLRSDCVSDLLRYIDEHPDFLEFFRPVLCGDEIFFDTIVHLVGGEEEIQEHNNLLFDDMEVYDRKNVGSPKTIRMEDIERIKGTGAFFARKFDLNVDREVIEYYLKR